MHVSTIVRQVHNLPSNPTQVLLGQSFNATTTGTLSSFVASQLLNVDLDVTSGTVNTAVVRLEEVSSGNLLGLFIYPQDVARWQKLPAPNMTVRFNVLDISGGGTLTISV